MTVNLTQMYETKTEEAFRQSPPGMAHFAGTLGEDKTCRSCQNFQSNGHYSRSANRTKVHTLKPGSCSEFERLMKKRGPAIPHGTAACSHFAENPKPPKAMTP